MGRAYLHLGQETEIKTADIIGIFDLDTSTVQKGTRDFLYSGEKKGKVENVSSGDLPKSFVLTNEGDEKIYISPISSATLVLRATNAQNFKWEIS